MSTDPYRKWTRLLVKYLTIDHLLYADDVKLIAPRKQSDALAKWSEDWELILNHSKSEHLPIGDF